MTIEEFNAADESVARAALLRCCGSKRWAEAMLAQRPFADRPALLSMAEAVWWRLPPDDWLEAFAAHPRIGEKKLSKWSAQEQNGIYAASDPVLQQLTAGNQQYERQFGWIFLINATGKSASDMLDALQARLMNPPGEELRVAAGEQARITGLRLNKLFDE